MVNYINFSGAIKSSLDLLNIHRVQNGLDNYGQVTILMFYLGFWSHIGGG